MSGPLSRTALLICDLQNDFIDPRGAYGRAGLGAEEIAAVPGRVKPFADLVRGQGGFIISTHFTLVPGKGGEPLISPRLKALRPFLAKGDFAPGAWGHAMIDILQPADFAVEKVAYSAFYMSRLEWVLRKAEIQRALRLRHRDQWWRRLDGAGRACPRFRCHGARRRLCRVLARDA